MKNAHLGDLVVSRIGLGAMTMAGTYTTGGPLDDSESVRAIHRALELGVTHIDTAEVYGPFHSEELVGRAVKGRRDEVKIATKFGLVQHHGDQPHPRHRQQPRQRPGSRRGLTATPRHRLHRPLLPAPCRPRTRRSKRQREPSPISSPRARSDTSDSPRQRRPRSAAPTPYSRSPRSRPSTPCGPATWKTRSCPSCVSSASASCPTHPSDTACSPDRSAPSTTSATTTGARRNPRFTGDNFQRNLALVDEVTAIGAEIGATPAQTALAWLLTRGDDIAPIPGTRRVARVEENTAAADIELTADQLQRLDSLEPAAGERHDQANMASIDR